ncbi:N-terminal Xaa-Pro-Lys N-methyltransferase 1 [Ischnura elegans]|uniref:N-terminal Xaa-Pro-Lys N-methyltransferase 1 n=1 Tax=Ischnura elegans TaxID=197161 RepID=UPI001ED87CCB|nr:N-terminal Xaa-Pro-Lys N-methyltransferase 1 [Ischnura elegans]
MDAQPDSMSGEICQQDGEDTTFYSKAAHYWEQVPPTVDGMLGGFGVISHIDIAGSEKFLKLLYKWPDPPGKGTALDCGAGIGRITKHLLQNHFETVDLVEQNPHFLDEAKKSLGSCPRIGSYYPIGLQSFEPQFEKYDVIWCQWVLGHLTDEDFVKFFKSCKKGLRPNGVIVVKENVSGGELEKDEQDSSVTRPMQAFKSLLHQAGLKIVLNHRQRKFPRCLYEVRMLALRPAVSNLSNGSVPCAEEKMEPDQSEESHKKHLPED